MRFRSGLALLCVLASGPAAAQSFPCERARTPAEKAICAVPSLGTLDRALAGAYADALRREPGNAGAIRAAQTQWLRTRDAACAVPAPRLPECLSRQMNERLAALAPPEVAAAPVATAPVPPTPPEPAIPAFSPPEPAATVAQPVQPAAAMVGSLLHVTSPGRFTVRAHSRTGASVQVVDMLAGPSEEAGTAGAGDGRLDMLLDVGTYKLRARMADGASDEVRFSATPYRSAAPPVAAPAPGVVASAALSDGEVRWFWMPVPEGGAVRVEAAGRALGDLRLWRDGTDLAALMPVASEAEPVRGHPMARMRLDGRVEPGTYLLAAYGGAPLAWADGAAEQPFHVRVGASDALALGWVGGTVGPFGSELFEAPADRTAFRLELPASAAATLAVDGRMASIAANSREPYATVYGAGNRALVEVTAAAGQPYVLRAMERSALQRWSQPGTWWMSASALGTGGDEVPPTVFLARQQANQPSPVVGSNVPRVSAASPLRMRFNVRGPTSFWLANDLTEPLTVQNAGTDLGKLGFEPSAWDEVPRSASRYGVVPAPGKQGVADLVFGRQGAAATMPPPWPADPVIPLGTQAVEPGQTLAVFGNTGPGIAVGLLARPSPVALAEGALTVTQGLGAALDVPVVLLAGGQLAITQPGVGDVPHSVRPQRDGSLVVTLPAPERPRTVVLAWRRPPAPRPDVRLPPAGGRAALQAGTPVHFDLRRDTSREFALTVPTGGLYRVETLGRLRTGGTIGTAFLPKLGEADANGLGQNMLLQRWLRAGQYRVTVSAQASAGRVGLVATPAPLLDSPDLVPGGSIRGRLPAGTGLRAAVVLPEAGRYRLELLGLGRTFTARLDDAEGWPLQAPQALSTLEQELPAGRYGLVVSPEAVDARVVARLTRVLPDAERTGHGPFALPFQAEQRHTWREPPGRDDMRAPDAWTFRLEGAAAATVQVSAGMIAELKRDGEERVVARLVGPAPLKGPLAAGAYRLEVASLGRNDRLEYTVALSTAELQPGAPRSFGVSASVPFAVAEPRVVSITSHGDVPLKAVLRDGAGAEVARYGDRGSDWNIAISRLLPTGTYRLELQPAVPPSGVAVERPRYGRADEPDAEEMDLNEEGTAQTVTPTPEVALPQTETLDGEADERTVELRLALPEAREPQPAGPAAMQAGGGVHRFMLNQPADGSLVLATASSSAELVLALERRGTDGAWRTVGLGQGVAPVVAAPADGDAAPWRASVWAVDGGSEPVRAALQAVQRAPQAPGAVAASGVEGAAVLVAAARVGLGAPGLVDVSGAGLLAGGWPGRALDAAQGTVAMQSDTVWVLAPHPGPVAVAARPVVPGMSVTVPVPAGSTAPVAAPPVPDGQVRAWVAQSGLGQPGLDAGQGMGVAPGSALAVGAAARVWGADGGALNPRVVAHDLVLQPSRTLDAPYAGLVGSGEAISLTLPSGTWQVSLALAPGLGAVVGHGGPDAQTVWGGDAAVSRVLSGSGRVLLVNTGAAPASAGLSWAAGAAGPLQAGRVVRRFIGVAGSFDLTLDTAAGQTLVVAGGAKAVVTGHDGQVRQGARVPLAGPGRVTVAHGAGPVVAWVEADGVDPWPAAETQPAALPVQMPMSGNALAVRLAPGGPALLRVRTTAPAILRVGAGAPELFAAGADITRYVAGDVTLRLDSPHDGPLSGTLHASAEPVAAMAEGLGTPVTLAPNGTAAWGFRLQRAAHVGVGVRAEPDQSALRLLDANGAVVGEGNAMLQRLAAGQYVLEARNAGDAAAVLRPAILGITPRGSGPPPEVARRYLELVGLAPRDTP